jgi:polyvinyl alcohol dehydrogenase (cytochrome)
LTTCARGDVIQGGKRSCKRFGSADLEASVHEHRGTILLLLGFVAIMVASISSCSHYAGQDGATQGTPSLWAMAGQDLSNSRNQPTETAITAANVSTLTTKWVFTTGASVSATPTVASDAVYFPDWAGNLYAVNRETGQQIWAATMSSYDGVTGAVSRVSPTLYGNLIILGDNLGGLGPHQGASVMAVNRETGELVWITKVDPHVAAIITGSAVVSGSVVYQGVSSAEEEYATSASYACCTFRGSVVALNAATGQIVWQTYDMPANNGATNQYSGGAVWQPPVVDAVHNMLYVGTGNNYSAPQSVLTCQQNDITNATGCSAADDYYDSVIGLNLTTGAVEWGRKLEGYDTWTAACVGNPGNPCPSPPGPDYDFGGSGGNLLSNMNMVGFGAKSGYYYALNPATGAVLWDLSVGPGGNNGGIQWGTATDGTRIYVNITNNEHSPYKLASGQTITGSAWNALDPLTGNVLWQTPDPLQGSSFNISAVSVANGVLYSGDRDGTMYALDASNGKILWSFKTAGTVVDGPSIADGVVYWASGYARGGGTGNNKVYAFALANAAAAAK